MSCVNIESDNQVFSPTLHFRVSAYAENWKTNVDFFYVAPINLYLVPISLPLPNLNLPWKVSLGGKKSQHDNQTKIWDSVWNFFH